MYRHILTPASCPSLPSRLPAQLNIANPATGAQKLIDVEDEHKLRGFYEKRISQEVEGDALGDEFKGYVFRITGGNDKQGFPMLQGMRVRLCLVYIALRYFCVDNIALGCRWYPAMGMDRCVPQGASRHHYWGRRARAGMEAS